MTCVSTGWPVIKARQSAHATSRLGRPALPATGSAGLRPGKSPQACCKTGNLLQHQSSKTDGSPRVLSGAAAGSSPGLPTSPLSLRDTLTSMQCSGALPAAVLGSLVRVHANTWSVVVGWAEAVS